MKWMHNRRGLIEGYMVEDDGVWVKIRLTEGEFLQSGSMVGPGQELTARKSSLTEIIEDVKK